MAYLYLFLCFGNLFAACLKPHDLLSLCNLLIAVTCFLAFVETTDKP